MRPARRRKLHRPIQPGSWLASILADPKFWPHYRHSRREINRVEMHARNPRGPRRVSGRVIGGKEQR